MVCPLCGIRKARRGCPALGRQICAVCCGTKRLVEISCPSDCTWLASAREHPPAAVVRRRERDVALLVPFIRDFSRRQSEIFLVVSAFLNGYEPAELQPLFDSDVSEAAEALASTFETSSRGVIYEHRPASPAADRLATGLKTLVAETGKGLGSSFERDATVVLRRLREAIDAVRASEPDDRRAFLGLVSRVVRPPDDTARTSGKTEDAGGGGADRSRLIVLP